MFKLSVTGAKNLFPSRRSCRAHTRLDNYRHFQICKEWKGTNSTARAAGHLEANHHLHVFADRYVCDAQGMSCINCCPVIHTLSLRSLLTTGSIRCQWLQWHLTNGPLSCIQTTARLTLDTLLPAPPTSCALCRSCTAMQAASHCYDCGCNLI